MNIQKLHISPSTPLKAAAAALILLAIAVSLTAYPLPAQAQALSTDTTLSALTVSPEDIIGFRSDRFAYDVGVDSTVTEATITATPTDSNAEVSFDSPDSDDVTAGHQVALSAGRNTVTITVTAENGSDEQDYTVSVNQSVADDYGWRAEDDLDGLEAAMTGIPFGIWSNSTTIWVVDSDDESAFAYNHDGTRDADKDFDFDSSHQAARGAWSDGEYVWIADRDGNKLYVYEVTTGTRQNSREFDLDTENVGATGVWSDGATIWVADSFANKVFAYALDGGTRQDGDDIDLASANTVGGGIWSDGATIWVSQELDTNPKLFAYVLDGGARVEDRDFNTLQAAGARQPTGLWSDGETMWVVDVTENNNKVYAYNMPPSADNRLSDLTVSPKNIIGFDAGRTSYQVGMASTVTEATVAATANHAAATVDYSGTDADLVAPGHQVNLLDGRNEVTITVTAEDDSTQDYTVSINRGVTTGFGWNAEHDFDGLIAAGTAPYHLWTNGTTIWVAGSSNNRKLTAFNTDGSRDSARDFETLNDAGNEAPAGIWSNGTTMWVADTSDREIYAYSVSTKAQDTTKKFEELHISNSQPTGIWSNDTTLWVADSEADKIFAYNLSSKEREGHNEFNTLDAADNNIPTGIWSDGVTMWVSDVSDDKIYAYNMGTKKRDQAKEFNPLMAAGQDHVFGITSNSTTMWVSHVLERKLYAYNMPSTDATLSALTVGPKDIIGFDADRISYEVGVASDVAEATVTATPNDANATVAYSGTDADPVTDGHQVTLLAGRNTVTITVTAENGSTQDYTVNVNRGVRAQYGWNADEDLDGLIAAGNRGPRGIWGNSTTFYISDFDGDKVYAYNRDGTRDDTKDFDTTGSTFPNGIWSDGTTLWVADSGSTTLFAYTLSNGNRNTGAEITLANPARGVWGNSTTIWAVNETTDKLEAYQKSDGTEDNDKDITLDSANADPAGIWSDDTTIWVADHADDKLYAYTLSNGDRDSSKDIDTSTSGNENPRGLWGEGDTIWVTDEDDDRVYSYNLVDNRSSDATLSDLITSPRNILRFDADRTAYEVGVASTVAQATVTATANDAKASVDYSGTDADDMTPGHQVDLSAGQNQVTVTVTAENDSTKTYRVRINRGVDTPFGWKAEGDLDGLVLGVVGGLTDFPAGIAESGGIFWISPVLSRNVLAYEQDGSRLPARDISLHSNNTRAWHLWTDGQTLWISDIDDDKLYAYRLSDGARQTDREFDLHTDNASGTGIWSDGTTIWVADRADDKVFAYSLEDGTRQESKEFDLHSDNADPKGIWSDGYIIWVADDTDSQIYAYGLESGEREANQDFNTPSAAQNRDVADIWSDGATMWVLEGV